MNYKFEEVRETLDKIIDTSLGMQEWLLSSSTIKIEKVENVFWELKKLIMPYIPD